MITAKRYTKLLLILLLGFISLDAVAQQSEVIARDTLTRAQKISQRGVTDTSHTFIKKGTWITGANISYSFHNNDNYNLAIIEGITSEGYNFRVSPMVAYAGCKRYLLSFEPDRRQGRPLVWRRGDWYTDFGR